jgi:ATP-dependent Lon protease
VLANVLQLLKLPDGTVKVLVEGKIRVGITKFLENEAYFEAEAREIVETEKDPDAITALSRAVVEEFERYAKLNRNIADEAVSAVSEAMPRRSSPIPWRAISGRSSRRSRSCSRKPTSASGWSRSTR